MSDELGSDNLIQVIIRGRNEEQVACFVCRKPANLGMALTKSRGHARAGGGYLTQIAPAGVFHRRSRAWYGKQRGESSRNAA